LTEGELRALYDECNENRFGGRLPKARREWSEPGLRAWVEWQHVPGRVGSTHPRSELGPSIWLSPLMLSSAFADAARVRRVLLHEMCHLEVGLDLDEGAGGAAFVEGSHGPRWQASMARLGREGEAWVEEDLRNMAELRAEEERLLSRLVDEVARLDPRLDFSSAVEGLSKKFARSAGRRWGVRPADLALHPRVFEAWHRRQGEERPAPATRGRRTRPGGKRPGRRAR